MGSRRVLIGGAVLLCLGAVSACGLENRPGAVGPVSVSASATMTGITRPSTFAEGFERVPLSGRVDGFVPTDQRWTIVSEELPSGQAVRILDEAARASILIQATTTSETPEQLCGRAIGAVVSGTEVTPVPHRLDADAPVGVHLFSCSAQGVPVAGSEQAGSGEGHIDVMIHVALQPDDRAAYVQMTRVDASAGAGSRVVVEQTAERMFELTVTSMG